MARTFRLRLILAAVSLRCVGKLSGAELIQRSDSGAQRVLVSNAFSRVSGFALRDGKRTPGMLIALVPQESERDGNPVRFDQSDGDGSFNVANLLPASTC